MPISLERIQSDIAALARFTDTPGAGTNRIAFSPSWRQARDYLASVVEALGCRIRIDAAGNLHARPSAIAWEAPAWISGSHIDTFPNGGNYDGVAGVVAALESLRAAREDVKIALPMEIVVFAASEGTTFGLGMVASRAMTGDLSVEKLANLKNAAGQSYLEAGAPHGVNPEKLAADRLKPGSAVGFVEIHAEEGPSLWNLGVSIGCVTEIAGRRHYRVEFQGVASHAGNTPMRDRLDALAGASEAIVGFEKLAIEMGNHTLITVGQIICKPNAINRIAERVLFTIDLRCPRMSLLASGDQTIRKTLEKIVERRKLKMRLEVSESQPSVELDARVCTKLRKSAAAKQIESITDMPSGTFHDAAIMAAHVPSAMLFVPSQEGISHGPDEFTPPEDIASAVAILLETVRDRRLE